jgi:Ca-activated chloride channel homolog
VSSTAAHFSVVAAHTAKPVELAMQRLWLGGRILPVGVRLSVQHVFRSAEKKPLEVIYSFPLPCDAALRSFRIAGDDFEAVSDLKNTDEAMEAYERGIADGSLSTLARQYADGLVNLTVGNIRPGETVTVTLEILAGTELRDDGFRFRFPFTLAPAYHSRAKSALMNPGEGEIELPSDEFGDIILPQFRTDASSLHQVGFDVSIVNTLQVDEIGSPSHPIRVRHDAVGVTRVLLSAERDVPDRDLVLDVRNKESRAQVIGGTTAAGSRRFAVVVPSTLFGVKAEVPRRIVFVLDRSGSMDGAPINQARKAIEACLAALAETDAFGVVAFDDEVEVLQPALVPGTRENRDRARKFLTQVDARGSTELAAGFLEAARMLDGAGDVLIITDGQVSGTERILASARSANIRLSCLGIGSASQDRFLSLLARETAGVGRFVTPRERVDLAAVDLFASIGQPVASALAVAASVEPAAPSQVFAGTPAVLFLSDPAEAVDLTWDTGRMTIPVPPGDDGNGETVRLLQGARLITCWDSRYPSEEAAGAIEKRKQSRLATRLNDLSREFGLASREMSLVAIVKRAGDRPGDLPETRVVPVGMPQDTMWSAYFRGNQRGELLAGPALFAARLQPAPAPPADIEFTQLFSARAPRARRQSAPLQPSAPPPPDDPLMDLATQLEPDGGMPGATLAERAAKSAAAVLAFVAAGHTVSTGAFRTHVARLVAFLKTVPPGTDRKLIEAAIEAASTGNPPAGNWLAPAGYNR